MTKSRKYLDMTKSRKYLDMTKNRKYMTLAKCTVQNMKVLNPL